MQRNINKIIFSIFIILIIVLIILNLVNQNKLDKYHEKRLFYMDTYIYIKFKANDKNKANNILKNIENIYSEYHKLTDRYNNYKGINNLYYINYNTVEEEYLSLDPRLYDIIKMGIDMYKESNGKIDISIGNITDIWHSYRESKIGIPTLDELKVANTSNIEDIVLKDGKIKNNHVNIDLGCIAKGYATQKVGEYLKKEGITEYLINAGGNVLVGTKDDKKDYKVGLEDPNSTTGDIFKVINVTDKSIVTSGGYERYYEYNGIKYHHIIDPDTLFPANHMKSVTVITSNSSYGDFLSTYLFLIDIAEGKKYVDSLEDVEAVWYTNDNEIITSKGIKKYE